MPLRVKFSGDRPRDARQIGGPGLGWLVPLPAPVPFVSHLKLRTQEPPVVALHTAIAIVIAVGLIIWLKVDPVISLLLASLYLGLASGVGFTGTIEAIAMGFGEIMAEVGLLIGFGVLIGAFLHAAGAFHRLLDVFVRVIGATRLPYALSLLHSTILPSIYVDVQVVLASPVARSAAPYIERNGLR